MARRKARRSTGPSNEAQRIARTITYYEVCLADEIPRTAQMELWAADFSRPFAAGEHVSPELAARLEDAAQAEAAR
ncbi:hypothetical protein [Kitasatospora purpeofusca]|uniref:hypothetical protein n=1 Tax=Kitasatospora purpeofusca TaxID=67352 RepID=UPI0036844C62